MTAPMYVPHFFVRQKITLMVNRYQIFAANPDGTEGELLAFAQQKRMAFKEQVTFYSDESKSRPVFSFRARQRLDVHAEHDVYDQDGVELGYFRKAFGASLVRSTWHLSAGGIDAVGHTAPATPTVHAAPRRLHHARESGISAGRVADIGSVGQPLY